MNFQVSYEARPAAKSAAYSCIFLEGLFAALLKQERGSRKLSNANR